MQFEKFIKTTQGVNFRTSPDSSIKNNVISFLSVGTILQVLEKVDNITWYKAQIVTSGVVGYISSKDIYIEDYEPAWLAKAKVVVNKMAEYLGVPYQMGSSRTTTTTFDCSDLVKWGFEKGIKYSVPSDSRKQSAVGMEISAEQLRTGDVLFYDTNRDGIINHVSIFVYPNKILHTYSTKADVFNEDLVKVKEDTGGVTYSLYEGVGESLYKPRPVIIKRYIDDNGNSLI
jgi:cell wall-associated NlpC family hydrolase